MRKRKVGLTLLGLTVVVALSFALYHTFGMRRSTGRERNVLPGEENLQARGQLQLVAHLGSPCGDARPDSWELFKQRLAEQLKGKVAPVASGYEFFIPDEFTQQIPPKEPDTPSRPDPPAELGQLTEAELEHCGSVAGGPLAAAVYGTSNGSDPCILMINYRTHGTVATLRRPLVDRAHLLGGWPVICKDGQGLAAKIDIKTPGSESSQSRDYLFLVEAPEWQPKLVLDSKTLGRNFRWAASTADRSSIYLEDEDVPGMQRIIRRLTTDNATVEMVFQGRIYGGAYFIPSPDESFLATGNMLLGTRFVGKGVTVVDCVKGLAQEVTWEKQVTYCHTAMGWSADVPGRLYFVDLRGDLWQLDIDLSQPGPQDADQSQQ